MAGLIWTHLDDVKRVRVCYIDGSTEIFDVETIVCDHNGSPLWLVHLDFDNHEVLTPWRVILNLTILERREI